MLDSDDQQPPAQPPASPAAESPARGQVDPSSDVSRDTRTRLLDAAERLFAERTFASTSLRQITAAADANIAAVHYHFGSKDELFRAVFHRRVGPVNDRRLQGLRALLTAAAPAEPSLEDVLRALVEPAAALRATPAGRSFACLIGRSLSADGPHWKTIEREFEGVKAEFMPVFVRLCPELSTADLVWRLHFGLASLCMVLSDTDRLRLATGGLCDPDDVGTVVEQIVSFTAAGLRAPATASPTGPRAGRPSNLDSDR
ncbi:TetR/AcrR family transcriptional regulator [Engelhardtia mirabilis]|uniref:Putative DNA-binding transcriptional regulator n=1 Tax=Engelhardtia mirabilis TaxID=2528011 RepID=A0A518BHW7_9BACT|nr:putative DNA-binding transcriptional regulator [Planctomycetes bacterium Pla133]QDV00897.1 putative DNA-binding transcriptional regulator [Planctomycetes bacterium Pla86]